jgi:hypothetical protein
VENENEKRKAIFIWIIVQTGFSGRNHSSIIAGNFVDFDVTGPFQNTRPDVSTNRMIILKSGVYHITADVSVILEAVQYVLFNINRCANGSDPLIGSFFDAINTSTNTGTTIQAFLNGGDEIGIFIKDRSDTFGRQPRYNRAALTVHLLDC